MGSDWSLRQREHEFASGRSAVLRESLPLSYLVNQGVFDEDTLDAMGRLMAGDMKDAQKAFALTEAVCKGMFLEPRMGEPDFDVCEHGDGPDCTEEGCQGVKWLSVPFEALEESEVNEVLELAFSSLPGAATFRGDGTGAGNGADSGDVQQPAKPTRRSAQRKSSSVRSRPAASGKTG